MGKKHKRTARLEPEDFNPEMVVSFTLPVPPSVNKATAVVNGRKIKAKDCRIYEKDIHALVTAQMGVIGQSAFDKKQRLEVAYFYYFADNRRRDIANYEKVLTDALQKAGVFHDDSQIDCMYLERMPSFSSQSYVEVFIQGAA